MAETKSQQSRLLVTLTALFAAFCGLYLLIGGAWLVVLGGSWYYPIAGLVMLGVTVMLLRGKRAALWLYAALLLATMIWGVWEVGFDFWALTPRSDILVFFGIWLILPFVWRRLPVPSAGAVGVLVVALLISGGIASICGWFNDHRNQRHPERRRHPGRADLHRCRRRLAGLWPQPGRSALLPAEAD